MIEKGRHQKPKLEREKRTCPLCKIYVEDEIHFLTKCPLYESQRTDLYQYCLSSVDAFQLQTDKERFIFIMSNEDPLILHQLGNFISNSMIIRDFFLEIINDKKSPVP